MSHRKGFGYPAHKGWEPREPASPSASVGEEIARRVAESVGGALADVGNSETHVMGDFAQFATVEALEQANKKVVNYADAATFVWRCDSNTLDLNDLVRWLNFAKTTGNPAARRPPAQETFWAKQLQELLDDMNLVDL